MNTVLIALEIFNGLVAAMNAWFFLYLYNHYSVKMRMAILCVIFVCTVSFLNGLKTLFDSEVPR